MAFLLPAPHARPGKPDARLSGNDLSAALTTYGEISEQFGRAGGHEAAALASSRWMDDAALFPV